MIKRQAKKWRRCPIARWVIVCIWRRSLRKLKHTNPNVMNSHRIFNAAKIWPNAYTNQNDSPTRDWNRGLWIRSSNYSRILDHQRWIHEHYFLNAVLYFQHFHALEMHNQQFFCLFLLSHIRCAHFSSWMLIVCCCFRYFSFFFFVGRMVSVLFSQTNQFCYTYLKNNNHSIKMCFASLKCLSLFEQNNALARSLSHNQWVWYLLDR